MKKFLWLVLSRGVMHAHGLEVFNGLCKTHYRCAWPKMNACIMGQKYDHASWIQDGSIYMLLRLRIINLGIRHMYHVDRLP